MPWWADYYKLASHAYRPDPKSKKRRAKVIDGAGVTQPDAIPDIRANDSWWGGGNRGQIRLRDSNDFVDLSSVSNRQSRYKEYERLRSVAEIEFALDTLANESCVSGDTLVCTPFGNIPIQELAQKKNPSEKFLVYCYNFKIKDYSLGWAHHPRKVKTAKTIRLLLDNGKELNLTPDHRVLMRDGNWKCAGEIKEDDELMPFYRIKPHHNNEIKTKQFPRIYTFSDGWKHERQFVDEWKIGVEKAGYNPRLKVGLKCLSEGLQVNQAIKVLNINFRTLETILEKEGFTFKEVKTLNKRFPDRRKVIGVVEGQEIDVYDLSVDVHENFATDSCIVHNCQKGNNDHYFEIKVKNESVKKELEFLFHRILRLDNQLWSWSKNLYCMGDWFGEVVIDPENPKDGILKINPLPADSMYRIETTKGKLLEFQQSNEGPDYQSLARTEVTQATDQELGQATALRFAPEQIIHMKIGDDRKTFYPYGISIIEPARGPAHQLRLMEDAMLVYRLCLIGDTRIRTTKGYKLLKDITKKDFVYSFADGVPFSNKVENFVNNGVQDVFKVLSKHVEITGTKTHPILVDRDGVIQYVDIQNLIPKKDKLILTTHDHGQEIGIPLFENDVWAKLPEEERTLFRSRKYKNKSELLRSCHDFDRAKQFLYSKGKALPLAKAEKICDIFGLDKKKLVIVNKNQRNVERLNLPAFVDEEFARLFGFLLGDGVTNTYSFGFAAGNDEKLNVYYKELLEKYFGKVVFEQDKRRSEGQGKYVVHSAFGLSLIKKMGYIENHNINRIPDWVYLAHKNIKRAFVEGLSDADGCERLTKAGTWFSTIELSNKELVRDIKELWSSIGLCSGKLKERKRKGGHEIEPGRIMPPTTSYSVTISDKLLPKYENVLSVTAAGRETVYDITVDGFASNFIANGIPVHNTRAPERRVFYIDVGNLPPNKAEAFVDRLKSQLRKKKLHSGRAGSGTGASSVEERWHAPSADEDFWLPIRPSGNTRIETLPGASNLGEVDDALYFRNKLYIALKMPKNYMASDDPNVTSKNVSSQNVQFARYIERLQMSSALGILEIAERHLTLRGFPQEMWDDLDILMTPPSEYRERERQDIMGARWGNAVSVTQGPNPFMSRYDAMIQIMKYQPDEAREMASRAKVQAIEDAKIQLMAQSPDLMGVGQQGGDNSQEMGGEAGGPNPMLGNDEQQGQDNQQNPPQEPNQGQEQDLEPKNLSGPGRKKGKAEGKPLAEPSNEDIKKYDLEIRDFSKEKDEEEIFSID